MVKIVDQNIVPDAEQDQVSLSCPLCIAKTEE